MNLFCKKELKLKKSIFLFLILLNPLLINSFANTKNIINQNKKNINITKLDEHLIADSELLNEAKNINPYINNLLDIESSDAIKYNQNLKVKEKLDEIKKKNDSVKEDNKDKSKLNLFNSKNPPNERKKKIIKINNDTINNEIIKSNNSKTKYLSTPIVGDISVGEFEIPTRGYVKLKEGEITLNLVKADAIQTLRLISKISGYGFVLIEETNEDDPEVKKLPLITARFENENISDAFNSILMASGLQAKIEKNIIFIGENIFNKSLIPKLSKTYRLNQANAASVGDYLATLGARISKVLVKGTSVDGTEIDDAYANKAELNENFINSYGTEGGPLQGLIGTVDLRLQTITLIGTDKLILTAEKYIKSMDARHRQVALSIKIIDVSLTKSDIANNSFELLSGDTYLINNGGLSILTGNTGIPKVPGSTSAVVSNNSGTSLTNNTFISWLEQKITNENAKIMASPTLILGENSDAMASGVASATGDLDSASIGRPFANEGFVKVGETVTTDFEVTTTDGVTTCTATLGTAGITFGAKVDKIDDNGYVTFSLSPAISSVTKTENIANCGTQSTLSVRKLDTGSIRVKNQNTLILTGVLKDEDNITTYKTPILGDIPILGRLFRQNTTVKRKSELIILVTPKLLND
tara:strand:- start:248 stop:2176 length:1929 start_codon:yes stop_codon:yes gene_type:complete